MENVTYQLNSIATGREGTRQTLQFMSDIVNRYKTHIVIRELALNLVKNLPEKRQSLEVSRLLKFVQNKIRYVRDINGVETLHSPLQILRLGQGDCDDKCILFATLVESIGYPTRFIACGQKRGSFTHVYVEVKINHKWVPAEPIMRGWRLGKRPRHAPCYMTHHNYG